MARARNLKPALFKNELLGVSDPLLTLLFQSLWTLADKEGRLEDRPLRIKAETFPYRDCVDVNGYLTELQRLGFIVRYIVNGIALIQVTNFKKHQTPHSTEKASELPPIDAGTIINIGIASTSVKSQLCLREETQALPPDSLLLTPSLLTPDSLNLIPDSRLPQGGGAENLAPPPKKSKPETDLQIACRETWQEYCDAYFLRYGTEPVRNATVNSQIQGFVKRIGAEESPHVAAFFVKSNSAFYVQRGHAFGNLLADAEKVRTEWATGSSMTATRARQIDKSQANASVVGEAMKILEGMNNAKNS